VRRRVLEHCFRTAINGFCPAGFITGAFIFAIAFVVLTGGSGWCGRHA
jgi:hypothetical protein